MFGRPRSCPIGLARPPQLLPAPPMSPFLAARAPLALTIIKLIYATKVIEVVILQEAELTPYFRK